MTKQSVYISSTIGIITERLHHEVAPLIIFAKNFFAEAMRHGDNGRPKVAFRF